MSDILHGRITEAVIESVKLWEATQHLHRRVTAASARVERLKEAQLVATLVNGQHADPVVPCVLCKPCPSRANQDAPLSFVGSPVA